MQKMGAKLKNMQLKCYDENYRGVHAKTDVKASDELLFIPKKLMITIEQVLRSDHGKLIFNVYDEL